MIGQTISHYTILEKLGEGGMGVVYKAEDTKLKRIVALKFLPHHLSANDGESARFMQEAQAAAALNHPNICAIHSFGEHEGTQFIEMEFVDGATLRKKLPVERQADAVNYAIQIGEALQEAHSKGIVHRDVKAENIMVNGKNQIKVMDFGLAKLKGSLKLTRTSSTVGTLAYMAPEQIQGGEVDARSDLFSFGIVIFEMLTGRTPFRGEHEAATVYSIVNEPPESLLKLRSDVSPELERIVNRAIEKDPEDRYQSAADMVSELRRVQKQSTKVSRTAERAIPASAAREVSRTDASTGTRPRNRTKQFIIAGVVVLLLAVGILGYFSFFGKAEVIDSIAVLPFENVGADPNTEYLSDGITESLINSLSQLSHLSVKSRSAVFHYKGKDVDPQKVGKELGVKAVLTGSVTQRGENLEISAELVDVSNDNHIWGNQYNNKLADILAVQDVISKEISKNLSLKLGGDDEKKLAKHATENTEAYQLYLKGKFYWNKRKADDLQKAIDFYNQAITLDSTYALAYAGLASTYAIFPEYSGQAPQSYITKTVAAANKAIELDPTLAEPHAALASDMSEYQWNWSGAEKEYLRAIELDPNSPITHLWYSICLEDEGNFDAALAEVKKALALDPLSLIINQNFGEVLLFSGRTEEALKQLKYTSDLDPGFPGVYGDLGYAYQLQGKYDQAVGEYQKIRQLVGPNNPFGLEYLGYAYAKMGKGDSASAILDQLHAFSKQGDVVTVKIAMLYAGLGDKDKAIEWLQKGLDAHDVQITYLKWDHTWDFIRSDPRFIAILKKVGLAA